MRFSIRAIGKIKEKWMREGIEEYSKRLKPVAKVDVLESDEEKMPENPSAAIKGKVLEKEGEKLLRSIQDSGCVVLLDMNGKKFLLKNWPHGSRKRPSWVRAIFIS